jgi:hypothetical protein
LEYLKKIKAVLDVNPLHFDNYESFAAYV